MECFICLRTGKKVFNINWPCGKGQNTIKADIMEFVGDKNVEGYLTDDQYCCSVCMNVLDDIVRYKRKVLDQIVTRPLTQPDLGRLWNFVAKSEAKSEFKEKSDPIPHVSPNTPPMSSSRDSTPTHLYTVRKTKSYNEPLEKKIERREGVKSKLSKNTNKYFIKKDQEMKEKYKIKSKSKKMKNDIVNKFQSDRELYDRPVSVAASEMSFVSYTEEKKQERSRPPKREIIYNGDEIVYPLKRTRSVSRSHEVNICEKKLKEALLEGKQLEETIDSCELCGYNCFKNMEIYTAHKVTVHGLCGYFGCKYCENNYLTQEHLSYHIKNHTNPIACPICKTVTLKTNSEAFASHMEQHIKELYDCRFCNKPFNTKENLNQHIFTKHKRKRIFYTKNEGRILKKMVYKPGNEVPQQDSSKKYKCIDYGDIMRKDVEKFRPATWMELDYLGQERNDDAESVCSELENLAEGELSIQELRDRLERLTGTPDSDGSFYNYRGIATKNTVRRRYVSSSQSRPSSSLSNKSSLSSSGRYTVFSKGGRSPDYGSESGRSVSVSLSGRCTPWSTASSAGSTGEEDQEVMRVMNNPTPSDLCYGRDLESRNTEVAEILAGEEEVYSPHSDVEDNNGEDADLESSSDELDTETQYLEGNSFVSSISYIDSDS